MASIPRNALPRIVIYHQTTHDPDGKPISVLPLITQPGINVTHLMVAAIHINEDAQAITLNNHHPSDPRYTTLWAELRILQASGIKVLGMLGGAAPGSYTRLDQDQTGFEAYYGPVHDLIRDRGLDGIDLDVEEAMTLGGVIRLIDRLRADFGPDFLITLAPVAAALLDPRRNLSGFDYEALEVMRGRQIAFYNTQFYCGWGDASTPFMYEFCVSRGWPPEKVVLGLVTTPENGPGFVPLETIGLTLTLLKSKYPGGFGGVMGWEYFNSRPGGRDRPWEWAQSMTSFLRADAAAPSSAAAAERITASETIRSEVTPAQVSIEASVSKVVIPEVDPDLESAADVPVPGIFEYYSDGLEEDDEDS